MVTTIFFDDTLVFAGMLVCHWRFSFTYTCLVGERMSAFSARIARKIVIGSRVDGDFNVATVHVKDDLVHRLGLTQ